MTNNDSLSLFKLIWHGLIASWYLGFLAADVAPAAGPGSSGASAASGFVLLKLRDYAADYFQTPDSDYGKVIMALRTVERWVGQDAEVLRNAFLSNTLPPTQRDWTGYNISYEVLNISASTPAQKFTDGKPGSGGLSSPEQRSQLLASYHSIDISYQVYWTIYSSYREEAQNFNATVVQQNFMEAIRATKNLAIWENWYLRTDIYPQAAPIVARLPLGYAEGLKVTVQLTGTLLVPFVVEMETLFLAALFRPLNERLFISQLNVIQVNQSTGSAESVNVTMSGVFGSPSPVVAQVFREVMCTESCAVPSANAFAQSFTQDNIALLTAHLLSVEPDGSSLQAQATAMGFPSSQLASATAADPSALAPVNHAILAESVSSIVGFCGFAAILLGTACWIHRRRQKRSDSSKEYLVANAMSMRRSRGSMSTPASVTTEASSAGSSLKDLQKWSLPTVRAEDIEICRQPDGSPVKLGRGGFCKVLKGIHGGIREVALKMLQNVEDPQNELERFTQELELLKMLNFDSRIVQLYGACILEGCPVLVLEFMGGGDLSEAISNDRSGHLRWYDRGQYIALDVVRGLAYLHACKCLHGDLTCKNILLSEDHSIAKIGDLGLSKMIRSTILELPVGGTLAFAAPEVLLNMRCNEKADMFSFAVVLWTICTQEVPIRGHLRTLKVPEECPLSIAQLIDDCLENPPKERPSARQAYDIIKAALAPMQAPHRAQEGPNEAVLEAAAQHCREMLSKSDLQQSMRSARNPGQQGQPIASMALSNLAPHDLHTGAIPGSSHPSRPNPFDLDQNQQQIS
ncbi:g6845 [Coccomyxa viridis]|uniref:G6845 protein n=1 Tax=Coccomyxa viridis TaxID=1274662 RepID=A0ABP1G2Y9_9CHLO